jgi:predicted O-methyltransferase YrrM
MRGVGGAKHRREVLRQLVTQRHWTRGAEIGVFRGDTYLYLLQHCPRLTLIGVDLWEAQPDADAKRAEGGRSYAQYNLRAYETHVRALSLAYRGRSVILKGHTVEQAAHVANASLDFVFIDADHTYEGVKADIAAWRPKVKHGGWLMGHDANNPPFPGVTKALNELCKGWKQYADHVWALPV